MVKEEDFISCKCKYYGYISYPKIFSTGESFPFNNLSELKKIGLSSMNYLKNTRKSFRNLDISIDKDVIKITQNKKLEPVYNFRSNKHYNPWSCIVTNIETKMFVIMVVTRNINSQLVICCDVIKFLDKDKKIRKFFELYQKYFIVNNINRLNDGHIYLNNENQNLDSLYEYLPTLDDIPEDSEINDFDNGYMTIGPDNYDLNSDNMEEPLLN